MSKIQAGLRPTMELAEFVAELTFDQLPSDLLPKLKLHILDTVGAGLFGSTTPWAGSLRKVVAELGGKEEATVWGTAIRLPAPNAAMLNAMSTHSYELDDSHVGGYVHPGSGTVTSGLAIAEHLRALDDGEFVTAVVAGYETTIRVGQTIATSSFQRGFYPAGMAISFGAVATAGKLLHQDTEEMARGFHLAATQASGLYSPTMVKRFNTARGVQSGVLAALLSSNSFPGILDAFEAPVGGFLQAVADSYDMSALTADLGTKFLTFDVGLKMYSCSRPNHTAIEAVRTLRESHPEIDENSIEEVIIECSTPSYRFGHGFEVEGPGNAFMSIAYCTAAMLVDGEVFIDQFTKEKINDARMKSMLQRITVQLNPEFDKLGPTGRDRVNVSIRCKSQRIYQAKVDYAKGYKERPLTTEEVHAKFRNVAGRVKDRNEVEEIIRTTQEIERSDQVLRLARLLSHAEQ